MVLKVDGNINNNNRTFTFLSYQNEFNIVHCIIIHIHPYGYLWLRHKVFVSWLILWVSCPVSSVNLTVFGPRENVWPQEIKRCKIQTQSRGRKITAAHSHAEMWWNCIVRCKTCLMSISNKIVKVLTQKTFLSNYIPFNWLIVNLTVNSVSNKLRTLRQ